MQKGLNLDIRYLYNWSLANKISLNCAKSELIFFDKPGEVDAFVNKINYVGISSHPSLALKKSKLSAHGTGNK